MKTIQAKINPRLLTKASRLFTGCLSGRIIEILQNARSAGATRVEITNDSGLITVRDNGSGISASARGSIRAKPEGKSNANPVMFRRVWVYSA